MDKNVYPQFLFGYDRGHSLIAGSDQLSARTEALLSRHSDAVPGIEFETMQQYWTGLPVNSKEYALISTWPAPEMPRPGCVWSHVVIIDRPKMAQITDLSVLRQVFRKPTTPKDYDLYRVPARVVDTLRQVSEQASREAIMQGLRAVYDLGTEGYADYLQSDRDEAVFEIWSQQWPDLRHSFRFNTAQQNWHVSGSTSEYWLQFQSSHRSHSSSQSIPSWIAELYQALNKDHPLRRLLQNAGPELPPVPSSVRLLARLFAFTKGEKLDQDLKAIKFAARELPSPEEGPYLKEWLIQETLRMGNSQQLLSLIEFLLVESKANAFPHLENVLQKGLAKVWRSKAAELFDLIEVAHNAESERRYDVIQLLAREAPKNVLLLDSNERSLNGKVILAEIRPDILLEADLTWMSTELLLKFLDISLQDNDPLAEHLFTELLRRPFAPECTPLFVKNTGGFIRVLVSLLPSLSIDNHIHLDWLKEFNAVASEILVRALSTYHTTTDICIVLKFLGWPQDQITNVGAEAWLQFFENVEDDAPLKLQQQLYATVLHIAFADEERASIELFELVAPSIYGWLKTSELKGELEYLVMRNAGHYFLVPFWDNCARFKRSLQYTYEFRGFGKQYWENLASKLK